MRKRSALIVVAGVWAIACAGAGCSSVPSGPPAAPPWVHEPARTVDSGYVVYVGTGEDFTPERAKFKAEASAIQDIANECSFAPKGTRVEDHYDYFYGGKYQSFAKVAVSFDDCDQAKQAIEPAKIQELANAAMTDQLKHYQEIEYEMPGKDTSGEDAGNEAQAGGAIQPAIQDDGGYFVVRQQVAYAKEIVILNPTAYPVGSVQSRQFVTQIQPQQDQIQQYEQVHPVVRTWDHSWSSFERHPTNRLPPSIPRLRGYAGQGWQRPLRSQDGGHGSGRRGKRRRRRRYPDE